MTERTTRSRASVLRWARAIAIGALTWVGMASMAAQPTWLVAALSLAAGLVALANTEVGALIGLVGLSLPILAANLVLGACVFVLAMVGEHYIGGRGANVFIIVGLAFVGALLGPAWATAVIAGFLLGPEEGALAAAFACFLVEAAGVLAGSSDLGAVIAGGTPPGAISFAHTPTSIISTSWLVAGAHSASADMSALMRSVAHVSNITAVIVQILVWAGVAAAVGALTRSKTRRSFAFTLVAVSGGVVLLAIGDAILRSMFGLTFAPLSAAFALVSSLIVVISWVAASEMLFTPLVLPNAMAPARSGTMSTEDADVDELLHLISTAEETIASQHTSECTVLITDMKSFSRMTEEDGSVATAKAIQRHRDLLVPIIGRNNGNGKSTGGDGVVAAFTSAADGVQAAVESQRALAEYNATHPHDRELLVRMGLACGEVVLDRGGRPFIGAGLNLAARVMNLADGGQIFATSEVVSSGSTRKDLTWSTQSFGPFELKNIAQPVEVAEVLWADGQSPKDPRGQPAPA